MALKRSTEFWFKLTYRYFCPWRPWRGVILAPGYNLNKLGRGPLVDAKIWPNIKALSIMVSDKKIFQCFFPYISQCKICDLQGGAIFGPRGIIHEVMLHTKYHGSRPSGFRQEVFFHVPPYLSLCKACDPRGGAIFGPRGIIWTNWVEGH